MKVVGFNGSPRKGGNTAILLDLVFRELQKEGIETEMVQLGGQNIHGCRSCYKCFSKKDGRCGFNDDVLNSCVEKMIEADGIILGSPTYFTDVTAEIKALIAGQAWWPSPTTACSNTRWAPQSSRFAAPVPPMFSTPSITACRFVPPPETSTVILSISRLPRR
jgi:hypothetical protein